MSAALSSYIPLLNDVEIWKEQSAANKRLEEIAGPLLNLDALRSQNDRDRNVRLRYEISRVWNEAVASDNQNLALELSRWIVKDWGGIKNISEKTIQSHHFSAIHNLYGLPFEHISSKSKVITLPDPYTYQIYDARVAVSLNVIQLAAGTDVKIHFEVPQSQITWISGRKNSYHSLLTKTDFFDLGFLELPKEEIYRYYTRLLLKLGVEAQPQLDPIEVEMALFGLAMPFSKDVDGVLSLAVSAERARLRTQNIPVTGLVAKDS